ncbi:MAG: Com family DNA-binding transcriptional regulator [Deltaproteobacteria bacterium]|nr:Com family DNA-binding transcriptional regulator [Deltaproteobacteria bacterium]
MQDYKCGSCRALLFKATPATIQGLLEIKCRRCGTINHLRPTEPTPERPRASKIKDARGTNCTSPIPRE